jgi:CheY-like chemotaxis protein
MENSAPKPVEPVVVDATDVPLRRSVDRRPLRSVDLVEARRALAGRRVMIVSDDVENAGRASVSLTRAGSQVRIIRRHDQLEPFLARSEPEMLVIDLDGLSGRAVALIQQLRAQARWADAIIVGLSARDSRSARRRIRAAGFDEVLPKPVDVLLFSQQLVGAVPTLAV